MSNIMDTIHEVAAWYEYILPLHGFVVIQRGVVCVYEPWRVLMELDEYLNRLDTNEGFGLVNELCKRDGS